jgi:hypothetical protein
MKQFTARFKGTQTSLETSMQARLQLFVQNRRLIRLVASTVWKIFPGSTKYWEDIYAKGGTSGPGSYNRLADFTADVINSFVKKHGITKVIGFGSGNGNQLKLARYENYVGELPLLFVGPLLNHTLPRLLKWLTDTQMKNPNSLYGGYTLGIVSSPTGSMELNWNFA